MPTLKVNKLRHRGLNNLPKITKLLSGTAGIWTKLSSSRVCDLNTILYVFLFSAYRNGSPLNSLVLYPVFSLHHVPWRSFHIGVPRASSFFDLRMNSWHSIVWMYHHLFGLFPLDEHFGSWQSFPSSNNAAMTSLVQTWLHTYMQVTSISLINS